MNSFLRMLPVVAAAFIAAALWIVPPASAADADASSKQSVGMLRTKIASAKRHHLWPRYHLASWYASPVRYADAGTGARQCYWFCGRPFVLMVGVAY
jgi:hypothetical protein